MKLPAFLPKSKLPVRKIAYLKQFIASPRTTGTIIPSSRFLCDALLKNIQWLDCMDIIELGAGDGVLTRKILERMRPDAKLTVFEIRAEFVQKLRLINDPRLTIRDCSAELITGQYDVIFSCLPLLTLPRSVTQAILVNSVKALREQTGYFVQFQYSRLSEKLLAEYFTWERRYVFRNIPPAFVYYCQLK